MFSLIYSLAGEFKTYSLISFLTGEFTNLQCDIYFDKSLQTYSVIYFFDRRIYKLLV